MQRELKHDDDDDLLQQVRSLIKTYVLLGCDYNAGFHNISHVYGIKIFLESSKTMLFSTSVKQSHKKLYTLEILNKKYHNYRFIL